MYKERKRTREEERELPGGSGESISAKNPSLFETAEKLQAHAHALNSTSQRELRIDTNEKYE